MSSTLFKGRHERVHEMLFRAHWLITGGAELVHNAIVECHAAGRYTDGRDAIVDVLNDLEKARSLADDAWQAASEARTALIGLTGCDGQCSERAKEPESAS